MGVVMGRKQSDSCVNRKGKKMEGGERVAWGHRERWSIVSVNRKWEESMGEDMVCSVLSLMSTGGGRNVEGGRNGNLAEGEKEKSDSCVYRKCQDENRGQFCVKDKDAMIPVIIN